MSWSRIFKSGLFMLWFFTLGVFMLGCAMGVQPSSHELGKIAITIDNSREAQLYQQKMRRLLARYDQAQVLYTLQTQLNFNEENDFLTMAANFSLYDKRAGTVIMKKSLESFASIGAASSLYSTDEARRHARARLAENLADKTHQYLLLFFARQESEPGP